MFNHRREQQINIELRGRGVTHVPHHEEHFLLLRLYWQVHGYYLDAFNPPLPSTSLSLSLSFEGGA